ncbi:fungal-specific transcription factor domain-containing protein [Fomitopsis serialis]|uniref:fungal-specific transcription factor domain-containing protein n=1 Tax=Fomitopsis serialis TaxID=139415 RepID=UPI00200795F7|nr:fungal-specific transcription factor domain-containing protein [Neoantrodia serialis]KAH9921883.1 fungal-specific transcription factor domain-containing protein [Neoantrodia serialis]
MCLHLLPAVPCPELIHVSRRSLRTCRLRRKKCDEEQEHDGGPCKTCRRLGIECLGWGVRRPDWMRDKERVAAYKASIKEQLTRAGLIRGQPRANFMQAASSSPAVAGPGPSSSLRRHSPLGEARFQRPYPSSRSRQHSGMAAMSGSASARTSPTHLHYNNASPGAAAFAMGDHFTQWTPSYPHTMSPTIPVPSNEEYTPFFSPTDASVSVPVAAQPTPLPPAAHEISDETYVMYYFESVRKEQFVFAGNSLTNTLYSIVHSDPKGPVANAICALSSLHYIRARIAKGLEPPDTNPDDSVAKQYYESARWQLGNARHLQYADTDAIAAILLVQYSLLTGGRRNWQGELEVACDWLAATRIHEEQNPKLTLMNMTPVGKAAAKGTMWIDVLGSVTLGTPPRFLALYQRLFGSGGSGFWANSPQTDVRMDLLTGCPDEVALAIGEISALASWKNAELRRGGLSVRELIRKGTQIETSLRQRPMLRQPGEGNLTPLDASLAQATLDLHLPVPGGMPAPLSSPSTSMHGHTTGMLKADALPIVGELWREGAILYLNTVLSENLPNVPEICDAVTNIISLLHQLPTSEYDRSLMFPLFFAGCMTDDQSVRAMVKRRLYSIEDTFGNIYELVAQMENLWNTRVLLIAEHGPAAIVPWRECLARIWENRTVLLI